MVSRDRRALSVPNRQRPYWSCPKCTLHNHTDLRMCDACGEARPIQQRSSPLQRRTMTRSWSCRHCTFINFRREQHCEICLRPREESTEASSRQADRWGLFFSTLEPSARVEHHASRRNQRVEAAIYIQALWRGLQGRRLARHERDAQERDLALAESIMHQTVRGRSPTTSSSSDMEVLFEVRAGTNTSSLGWSPSALPPGLVKVAEVLPASWAERHGLCADDELVSIGVSKVANMRAHEMIAAMRQRPLALTFLRKLASHQEDLITEHDTTDVHEQEWLSDSDTSETTHSLAAFEDGFAHATSGYFHFQSADEVVAPLAEHGRCPKAQERSPSSLHNASGFPIRVLCQHDLRGATGASSECSICLQDYEVGDRQLTLPCFHTFHQTCVEAWMRRSGLCPCCKHPYSINSG